MEDDIENYSPTVMFRGTPCMLSRPSLPLTNIPYSSTVLINNKNNKQE